MSTYDREWEIDAGERAKKRNAIHARVIPRKSREIAEKCRPDASAVKYTQFVKYICQRAGRYGRYRIF